VDGRPPIVSSAVTAVWPAARRIILLVALLLNFGSLLCRVGEGSSSSSSDHRPPIPACFKMAGPCESLIFNTVPIVHLPVPQALQLTGPSLRLCDLVDTVLTGLAGPTSARA
jgi:hypothetical protein